MLDKDSFCELIRLHEKSMYALAFSIVRNDADAAEVISEAIYRAYRNLASLKNMKAFKPWVLKIIHNTAVDYIRKNTKIVPLDDIEMFDDGVESEIVTTFSLWKAVDSLSLPYRTVIVLYYYEDLPIAQIANVTNTTIVTVKQRLSRARKQLRKILKEEFRYE